MYSACSSQSSCDRSGLSASQALPLIWLTTNSVFIDSLTHWVIDSFQFLRLTGVERINRAHVARFQTFAKPASALLRGSVGKRIRHHVTLAFALQTIIADRARGAQRFFDISGFDDAAILSIVGPNPCQEIGLQLQPDRDLVRLFFAHPSPGRVHPIHCAEQVLKIMTHLLSDAII